ncbi:MAG: trypsin-like serine protease [Fimbriimonadaceae bacterium]
MKRFLITSMYAAVASSAFAVFGLLSTDHDEFADFVGTYGGGSGVAISPYHVLTAAHLVPGGQLRDFTVKGETFNGVEALVHSSGDLALITLDRPVSNYVPLYAGGVTGQEVMIVGMGSTGDARDDGTGYDPNSSRMFRVVSNMVAGEMEMSVGGRLTKLLVADLDATGTTTPEPYNRDMLGDGGATAYEGGIDAGDSGGAWLVNTGEGWQLAGISLASLTANDAPTSMTNAHMRFGYGGSAAANVTSTGYGQWVAQAVPEPSLMVMAGLGLAALARRKKRANLN